MIGTTAVVYSEGFFGTCDGKTANGLVRHSEKYEILSVIDSTKTGLDAGAYLDDVPNGISICADLAEAITLAGHVPDYFILGVAPLSGLLSPRERGVVLDAMRRGMHIVNGLHEFLNDDLDFTAAAAAHGVRILDVRRPRAKKDLHMFTGRIDEVTCPRIAVLGTDGAIGKRTTATILTRALNDRGIKTVMVCTGQTGLIQGARYGMALDAIPCQFCSGEVEGAVVEAFEGEHPDVIINPLRARARNPRHGRAYALTRASGRDGAARVPQARGRSRLQRRNDSLAFLCPPETEMSQSGLSGRRHRHAAGRRQVPPGLADVTVTPCSARASAAGRRRPSA